MFTNLRKPDFHRLVTTLFAGKADAVPLIELGIHPIVKAAILGRPVVSIPDDVEFMRGMGYDFIKIQPSIHFPLNQQFTKVKTPDGNPAIAADRAWAPEHSGIITSWNDFERYPWPTKSDIDYKRFEEARGKIPEGMGVIGQYGDVFTVVWQMMGFEKFAYAVYEQPDLVSAMFDKVGGLILSMFETMADMEWVGALWFSDDIAFASGTLLKPQFFRERFFPLLRYIGDLARRRGIPFIYHSDGVLWSVMDDIIASGVTALHPIEPKAMDIVEVKRRYGDRLALCGGIEVDTLARGGREEVLSLVRRFLKDLGPDGGWCAGSSNSIPDYVPVGNYLVMVETVLREGSV